MCISIAHCCCALSSQRTSAYRRQQAQAEYYCYCRNTPHVPQGEYQQLDIIGKGAFGCAYKARHLPTGRLVCIKTLEAPSGHDRDEQLVRQKREIAVLAALALHPNIIRYAHAREQQVHVVGLQLRRNVPPRMRVQDLRF
jgi:serine/threonine protein kinase